MDMETIYRLYFRDVYLFLQEMCIRDSGIGELIGGSQREEDYDKLVARMDELGLDKSSYDWYLNLRKFGGVEPVSYTHLDRRHRGLSGGPAAGGRPPGGCGSGHRKAVPAGDVYKRQLTKERVSDRTLPVIQVAPRTLQDSLFALNFQGCLLSTSSCV